MLLPKYWLDCDLQKIATLAPVQKITMPIFDEKGVNVFVKREDLLHPLFGGNKIYKLHGFLNHYRQQGITMPIASFGGAFSNHLLALAAAGAEHDIDTVGVVRGDDLPELSPTLRDAKALGMKLHFASRGDYRLRDSDDYRNTLEKDLGECYWIPEGGSGPLGSAGGVSLLKGVLDKFTEPADAIFHACGTGSTFAGLVAGLEQSNAKQTLLYGVSILKGAHFLNEDIEKQLHAMGSRSDRWVLLNDYHFGGYAKFPVALSNFISSFERINRVLLDPVYTAKVLAAICDQVKNDRFIPGSHIVAIHSGGLQGRRGFGLSCDL